MPFGDEALFPREYACQDCGQVQTRHTREAWPTGQDPSVCKACQNARYLARLTPEQRERRSRRKALQAQRRRLEARISTAQDQLQAVLGELAELDGTSDENAPR